MFRSTLLLNRYKTYHVSIWPTSFRPDRRELHRTYCELCRRSLLCSVLSCRPQRTVCSKFLRRVFRHFLRWECQINTARLWRRRRSTHFRSGSGQPRIILTRWWTLWSCWELWNFSRNFWSFRES